MKITKSRQKICVLVSGGMDSSILLALIARQYQEVHPLYIRCGLNWEKAELYWLKKYLKKIISPNIQSLKILNVPVHDLYKDHWSLTGKNIPGLNSNNQEVYLPGRNILLLSHTAIFCSKNDIPEISLGILKGNQFPDSQKSFFSSFEKMIMQGLNFSLKIQTPFSDMSKVDVLKLGKDLPLNLVFSCLKPDGIYPCGKCNKCAEREKVMRAVQPPLGSPSGT